MKFYMRNPLAALEGMAELTLEQVGAYTLLLDHMYCRDGVLADDASLITRMLNIDPRQWRRLRAELILLGKIRITVDGLIEANGVTSTLLAAEVRSTSARHAADVRWSNYKKAKQNKETVMRERNASYNYNNKDSSTNSESEIGAAPPKEVAEKSKAVEPSPPSPQSLATGELEDLVRAKGWVAPKPLASSAITKETTSIPVSDELRAIIRRQNAARREDP